VRLQDLVSSVTCPYSCAALRTQYCHYAVQLLVHTPALRTQYCHYADCTPLLLQYFYGGDRIFPEKDLQEVAFILTEIHILLAICNDGPFQVDKAIKKDLPLNSDSKSC
jgi:hypothetical protein